MGQIHDLQADFSMEPLENLQAAPSSLSSRLRKILQPKATTPYGSATFCHTWVIGLHFSLT
jgi:hypothetical protein